MKTYKIQNPNGIYFITFSVINWIDVFTRRDYKDVLVDSLNYCTKEKGLEIYAWVIMTNHVHLIASSSNQPLEFILRDLKKYTAKLLVKMINENIQESRRNWMIWMFMRAAEKNCNNQLYQFWQQDNHPLELTVHREMIKNVLDYIHYNPVKAGFVDNPEDYSYSSARNFAGDDYQVVTLAPL